MPITLVIHIAAGLLAIPAGYAALAARKGAGLHRRSGMVFVGAMLVMGITGSLVAFARGIESSQAAGLLVAYFVVTALSAVRPRTAASRR
ncbi:MAG TPA: DUF2306 domain-containing protein, partial [Longimicrobium sp.]|nr:DUF2306 domain-containing protein [Longimicrobium sp.]